MKLEIDTDALVPIVLAVCVAIAVWYLASCHIEESKTSAVEATLKLEQLKEKK